MPLPRTPTERQKAVRELRERRAARGMADPLNRLSAHIAKQIENGAPVFINQPVANKES